MAASSIKGAGAGAGVAATWGYTSTVGPGAGRREGHQQHQQSQQHQKHPEHQRGMAQQQNARARSPMTGPTLMIRVSGASTPGGGIHDPGGGASTSTV